MLSQSTLAWMTVFRQYGTSQLGKLSLGVAKLSTSFAGVKVGMSPLLGDSIWHMSSHSGKAVCKLLYSIYFAY